MSVVRYKQDRNGISGTLTVRITSETQYGAVGAGGLGPASNPVGVLNTDGWLRSANGSSDYTMSGVRQGIDPDPPVHRLTVYQGNFPISSVEFYPYETEPGIIDVLVQAAVYNAPDLPTNDKSTIQAYTSQVQGFAAKLEQMKSYFEYANPNLTSQLTAQLNSATALNNTLQAQLPQTIAITNAAKFQGDSTTTMMRSRIRNRGFINQLPGHKTGVGPLPESSEPITYAPTSPSSPLSTRVVSTILRMILPSSPRTDAVFGFQKIFSPTPHEDSIYRLHQFGVYINVVSLENNGPDMYVSADFWNDETNQIVANIGFNYSVAQLKTVGTESSQGSTAVDGNTLIREYRDNWSHIAVSLQAKVPYNRIRVYVVARSTTPNVEPSKRVFEILHPVLLSDTLDKVDPFTIYPDNDLEIDYQPIASQNAINAANSANQWASAAQNAANNANVAAQNASSVANSTGVALGRLESTISDSQLSTIQSNNARDSANSAALSANSAASQAQSAAELAFANSNINVLFLSSTASNPRAPTQAELTTYPSPLYGARAGSPDGWQRILWSPHTTAGSWTVFGPRLGAAGLTVDQYVNASGTGVVRDSARLGGVASSQYARLDTLTVFQKAVNLPLLYSGRKTPDMVTVGQLIPRLPNADTNLSGDYQDELALAHLTPGRTVAVTANGSPVTTGVGNIVTDNDASLIFPQGSSSYPIVVEFDFTNNSVSAASNGRYRPALTFRTNELPTGILVENWDGTAYQTVVNSQGLTASDFFGGFWIGDAFTSVPAVGSGIRKLRFTLTGPNPLPSILYLQRVILYHATADYDPWRLHRKGGQMLGDVDFIKSSPKVDNLSLPERSFLRSQTGGTIGRIVRRNGSNNWVNANPTDSADQLAMLGVRVGVDQVIISGLAGGFSGLTVGAPVYLLANGAVSSARPSGAVKIVGFAHTANDIQLAGYTDLSDRLPRQSPQVEGSLAVQANAYIGGFELTLGTGDQVTRGNTGTSRALVKENSTLKINYAGDFSGGTMVMGPSLTVSGFDLMLGSGDQSSRGNSGLSRVFSKAAGSKLLLNVNGDFTGGVELQGSGGLKVIGPVSGPEPTIASHLATKNYVDSKSGSLVPRGSGGTPGYLVTRKGAGTVFQNLLPSSPLGDYRTGRVAVMGEFGPIYPGQTGRVNGLAFSPGRVYFGGLNGEMVPVPEPRPDDWPPLERLNADTLYYEAGQAYSDGTNTYFIHEANALVRYSDLVLGGEKMDLQTIPPFPTSSIGNGMMEFVNFNGVSGVLQLRSDDDPIFPATMLPSPVVRSISGQMKGVSLYEKNAGSKRFRTLQNAVPRLGGDVLAQFQVSVQNWEVSVPGLFFSGVGNLQGGFAYSVSFQGNSSAYTPIHVRKVTFAAGTVTEEAPVLSVASGVTRAADTWYMARLRIDAATKKLYVRFWASANPEPTTWQVDGLVLSDMEAGYAGFQSKDSVFKWATLVLSPPGVVANV